MSGKFEFLRERLAELEAVSLRRRAFERGGAVDLCSNDYLGLAQQPLTFDGALRAGSGGSRLVTGDDVAVRAAERACASWVNHDDSLLFSSGYAANVGLLQALLTPADHVFSDSLNHASIIDGCRLSGARRTVVPHGDLSALDVCLGESVGAQRIVVVEGVYSMDGDSPRLRELREVCDRHGALLVVDEAHALGVCGPEGGGACRQLNVRADIVVGTLGKSVGLQGAFVAGPDLLRDWLWNRARSFVFSTGVSPVLAAAMAARVAFVRSAEDLRERVWARQRALVQAAGVDAAGLIVPVVVGGEMAAVDLEDELRSLGVAVKAIRPPTVPAGSARLRFTANLASSDRAFEAALGKVASVLGRCTDLGRRYL